MTQKFNHRLQPVSLAFLAEIWLMALAVLHIDPSVKVFWLLFVGGHARCLTFAQRGAAGHVHRKTFNKPKSFLRQSHLSEKPTFSW